MKDHWVIYQRVSTSKQIDGTSLELQNKLMIDFIVSKVVDINKIDLEVIEDAGQSGSSLNRPGIQRILEKIDKNNIDFLVFYSLDRLSRSNLHILHLLQCFQAKQIRFFSVRENLDTSSPSGWFQVSVLAACVQLEHSTIRERVLNGKKCIADQGRFIGGTIPFGYSSDKQSESGLVVEQDEARIIRSIFYYRSIFKYGYLRIANKLNSRGLCKRDGHDWTAKAIQRIIQHKQFYEGKVALHRNQVKTKHPAILQSKQKTIKEDQ